MRGWDIRERITNSTRPQNAPSRNPESKRRRRLAIEYGLRNKREVWKAQSYLRRYRKAARELLALMSAGTDRVVFESKKDELIGHMQRAGLLGPDADIDNVLSLKVQQGLERRLQTLVYRQGLARSPKQARQTHHPRAHRDQREALQHPGLPRDKGRGEPDLVLRKITARCS